MAVLEIVKNGEIVELILNRPQVSNAFNSELIRSLGDAFRKISPDSFTRAVVLSGAGKNFCAGADLNWMSRAATLSEKENLADVNDLYDLYNAIQACPKPIVCVVQGKIYAGGVGLAAASDLVIASGNARFCISEAKVGMVPVIMSPFVVQKLGFSRALELSLTAREFNGKEALALGLVNFLTSNGSSHLKKKKNEILQIILKQSPKALAETKKLYQQVLFMEWKDSRKKLTSLLAQVRVSGEAKEGISAFLEKRVATWVSKTPKLQVRKIRK